MIADLSSIANENWIDRAICPSTAPNQFFAKKGGPTRAAKRVCVNCPVKQQCLDFALRNNEKYGVWGGTSPKERRGMVAGVSTPPPAYNPADYTRADGHGFRGYKRGCTCQVCLAGNARYQRDYKRRTGLSADRFCQQCSILLRGSGRTRYCSEVCRLKAKAARAAARHRDTVPPEPKIQHHRCVWCTTPFEGHPRAKYCSLECRASRNSHQRKKSAA